MKSDPQFQKVERLYMSILLNRDNIMKNTRDTQLISEILGTELMAKMTETEIENKELRITIQNLVTILREESTRCKQYANDQIQVLQDLYKVMKLMESDHESDEEMNIMELITTRYKDINQRLAHLQQFKTKYHQINQITDRASMKAGGIEKYEHLQFAPNHKIYFEDSKRNTIL